jgi:hypothetical protein
MCYFPLKYTLSFNEEQVIIWQNVERSVLRGTGFMGVQFGLLCLAAHACPRPVRSRSSPIQCESWPAAAAAAVSLCHSERRSGVYRTLLKFCEDCVDMPLVVTMFEILCTSWAGKRELTNISIKISYELKITLKFPPCPLEKERKRNSFCLVSRKIAFHEKIIAIVSKCRSACTV